MNHIRVKCPLCNHIQEIPDIYANKAIKCRKCYKSIEAKPYDEPIVIGENKEQFICNNCGYLGYPRKIIKGDLTTEILLWLFLFPFGIIYTVWRRCFTIKYNACPLCNKNDSMIPTSSPMGQKLLNQIKEK